MPAQPVQPAPDGALRTRIVELEALLEAERSRARRLAEANEAKSRYLNVASHELRGPLTVLTGHLSLLESGALGPIPEELAQLLPQLIMRLAEMETFISAMVETARLDDDRLNLMRVPTRVVAIVDEATRRCQPFLHPGQRIDQALPDEPLVVEVDRSRMVLALGCVIHNAIKHSPRHGDVRVAVQMDSASVAISVSDDGIGVAAGELATLFTRFGRVRTDPAVATLPGTGLGLYLARALTRAHGGDITVVSEPDVGSTFTQTLPLAM